MYEAVSVDECICVGKIHLLNARMIKGKWAREINGCVCVSQSLFVCLFVLKCGICPLKKNRLLSLQNKENKGKNFPSCFLSFCLALNINIQLAFMYEGYESLTITMKIN